MNSNEFAITNLIYKYNELIDEGDLNGAASLFQFAELIFPGFDGPQTYQTAQILFKQLLIIYPNGTPNTRHIVTNPIIEIDEDQQTARCRSIYTVFQATDDLPLQPIVIGTYRDKFKVINGKWQFVYRDYASSQTVGNVINHLRINAI